MERGRTGRRAATSGGFTLIEVMITLVVLVLAVAVVIPAVSKTSLAELRANAGKVAGTVRATYDQAALGGRSYRIAFDIDKQQLRVEVDKSRVQGGKGLMALAEMMKGGGGTPGAAPPTPASALKDLGKAGESGSKVEQVQPPKELLGLFGGGAGDDPTAAGLADFESAGHDLSLPSDAHLMDVWIEGMNQPAADGVAYLQFWPGGYTQEALIHLADNEGTVFTVEVSALTGSTRILDSYVEAKR